MAGNLRRYYWDSCAWIGLINSEVEKIHPLRSIWESAQRGECELWTSAYAHVEVIKGVSKHGDPYPPEESDKVVDETLGQPYVFLATLDGPIAKLARTLKRSLHDQGLSKRPDAIHLATALYWNMDELHTWDRKDLLQFNGKLTTRKGTLLQVRIPGAEDTDIPLFASLPKPDVTDDEAAE